MTTKKNNLLIDDTFYQTEVPDELVEKKQKIKSRYEIRAIIPGIISEIMVRKGQKVTSGQVVLILEAMKMFNDVESEIEGKIVEIKVSKGDKVEKGQLMIRLQNL
jgi:biotin carboxyl carrier protein